jgi:hypothetical protein
MASQFSSKMRVLIAFSGLLLFALTTNAQGKDLEKRVAKPEPAKSETALDFAGSRFVSQLFICSTDSPQCRTGAREFSAKELRDLYVYVTWPKISGTHTQELRFYFPDGNLYVAKATTFHVRHNHPWALRPQGSEVPERFFTTSRGEPAVMTYLGVAGTLITQRSLFGTWSVDVLLDGKRAHSVSFTLTGE